MGNYTLLNPISQDDIGEKYLAPRLDDLDGKVLGLLDITKNGSEIFLERVEELVRSRFDIINVVHVKKPTFSRPAPVEILINLADQVDFVIEGLAD